ncbi:hypothetical protein [Phenylobacterium sp.]|uniref:hypothetical protein n=1 Tax=Phenylobacterium sp. TaxID=1871053 RepID=UPI00272F4D5E|nr:hypothetical protein [Phenylobacterium sp.]MDP1617908.1 hypothetical protein [Phenylobacterium sp.]MDP1988962.1 hypothetical protein [Phenylobacterium sp.]
MRFPLPVEVRHAFLNAQGEPKSQIIESLGTTDIRIANEKADRRRTEIREDIRRVREARASGTLGDFLRWLHEYEMAAFQREQDAAAAERRRERFRQADQGAAIGALRTNTRMKYGAALTSDDPDERLAVAAWAADKYFEQKGVNANRSSAEYRAVAEECARILADAVIAQDDILQGRPARLPISSNIAGVASTDLSSALTDRGKLKLSAYFAEVYAPSEGRDSSSPKGERNIGGKRQSVRLFVDLVGDKPVCAITKGDLYELLDKLQDYPDSRRLTGELKRLSALGILGKMRSGELELPRMSPKTPTNICRTFLRSFSLLNSVVT